MRRIALLVLAVAATLPATALAVWGGQEDLAHPGVGAMYFDFMGTGVPIADGQICSGSYAGESKDGRYDVFLTAGHCLPPADLGITPGQLYVSFDRDAGDGVSAPIQVNAYHQMPGFGHDLGDLRDLGILLLPVGSVAAGIPAVELPPAGYLDRLKRNGELNFRIVDLVGYGVVPTWDEAGPNAVRVRRQAALGHVDHHRAAQGVGRSRAAATASATRTTRTTGLIRRSRARSSASSSRCRRTMTERGERLVPLRHCSGEGGI